MCTHNNVAKEEKPKLVLTKDFFCQYKFNGEDSMTRPVCFRF